MGKELLVCIPAYNEEGNIEAVLDDILASPIQHQFDVLVIDDGSTDNTAQICRNKQVMVITNIYNIGYGSALKTAYKYAAAYGYDYVIQIDADGQHDVCNIEWIYERLKTRSENPPDIVIGSRFLQGSVSFPIPLHKKIVINIISRIILFAAKQRITDPTSGLQGLSRRAFCFYAGFGHFAMDYPDANMVIQMILRGFTVEEIPSVMHPRVKGTSMHTGIYKPMAYIVKMALSISIVCLRESLAIRKEKRRTPSRGVSEPKKQRTRAGRDM